MFLDAFAMRPLTHGIFHADAGVVRGLFQIEALRFFCCGSL
jgi:hypothetical protein